MEMNAQSIGPLEDVRSWQQQLLRGLLRALLILGALALAGAAYDAIVSQKAWEIPIFVGTYAVLLVMTLWKGMPYAIQAGTLLSLLYALGVFNLLVYAQNGDGFIFLLTVPFMAAVFFGWQRARFVLGLTALTLAVFTWVFVTGRLVIPVEEQAVAASFGSWASRIVVFVMLALMLALSQDYLFRRLVTALSTSHELTREVEGQRLTLERQVGERTADLARRARYLEATSEVAREAAAVLNLEQLLSQVVNLVSERFGFYHTGIFLVDASREWAELQAASSEGGRRMLARGHRLRVGIEGIVGYVTGRGEARIALDVGEDAVHFDNPDLPETRSEMALPLKARGDTIGALDVQSQEPGAFSAEDVAVLQTLAEQVAIAISNLRLFEQAQGALKAERRAYGESSRQAWADLLRTRLEWGYRYDHQAIAPAQGDWQPEMIEAAQTGVPTHRDGETRGHDGVGLAMPIKVREQVIGVLNFRKDEGDGPWATAEVTLLETLVEQLGTALESARLYQDTQRRAIRERLTGEITSRMRSTLDLETILQTATDEIYQALGLDRVTVRLTTTE
jgi:GAF domain-containing protein